MPFCSNCGTEVPTSANFCGTCGRELAMGEAGARTAPQVPAEMPQILPYHISSTRVLLMMVLSYGSYLFYWFYLTWKQYRDHTHAEAYPVWHALTLFVPIYSLFRTHAHVSSFKELMLNTGRSTNLSVGGAVLLMFVNWVLASIGVAVAWGYGGFSGQVTQEATLISTVTGLISLAVLTGLIIHVQGNVNQYWASLKNVRTVNANIATGEVFFVLLGVLIWGLTLADLLTAG